MSDMVGLPFPADPSERFSDVLPCGCELAQGTWFYCAQHQFEQQVIEALREIFRTMRLTCAGRQDDPLRWSGDDLATDLAPSVAAAIDAVAQSVWDGETGQAITGAALAALRVGSRPAATPETPEEP